MAYRGYGYGYGYAAPAPYAARGFAGSLRLSDELKAEEDFLGARYTPSTLVAAATLPLTRDSPF